MGFGFRKNLIQYGHFPWRLFALTIVIRAFDLFLVQSVFVPDEYWQSVEVAHKRIFGYGALTWEWSKGIRSSIYVWFISGLFYLLKFFSLDSRALVVLVPRAAQALLSALADVYFVRWVYERRGGQYAWALLSWVTCYFVSYCSTRTLINTVEMNLTVIALYYYPWTPKKGNKIFVALVALLAFIRPTSDIVFIPLVLINLLTSRTPVKLLLTSYLPIGSLVASIAIGLDYLFYERFVLTPWEFFKLNIIQDIGSMYGVHNYLWLFYCGLPAVLGLQFFPFMTRALSILSSPRKIKWNLKTDVETQMVISILWSVTVFSLCPHKEFRFLLPLMPMMVFLSSSVLSRWSSRTTDRKIYLVAILLIVGHYCSLLFLGQFHKAGGLPAMKHVSELVTTTPESKVLFLMPCHSLPYYSHIHVDVPMRFLTCEPNFSNDPKYKDEADIFYEDPVGWLKKEYVEPCSLPTVIVSYNSLNITNYLYINSFTKTGTFFDSYVISDRTGSDVNVHQRKGKVC